MSLQPQHSQCLGPGCDQLLGVGCVTPCADRTVGRPHAYHVRVTLPPLWAVGAAIPALQKDAQGKQGLSG